MYQKEADSWGLVGGASSRLGRRLLLHVLQHHPAHLLAAHQLAAGLHDVTGPVARVKGGGDSGLQAVCHLQVRGIRPGTE